MNKKYEKPLIEIVSFISEDNNCALLSSNYNQSKIKQDNKINVINF